MLAVKNAHPRDSRITFVEDTHTYFIDGDSSKNTSVTTFLHHLFPKFDADVVVDKMMRSKNWRKSPYFGRTKDDIKDGWERSGKSAAEEGTRMHLNIENYYNEVEHETSSKEFSLFQQFVEDHPWTMFRTEWMVYVEEAQICGSVDAVFEDPDDAGAYVIADWKRSKKIDRDNMWERGTHALTRHLPNCNFITYSLQLSTYRYILETYYGLRVTRVPFLVVLHPTQSRYQKIETLDLRDIVRSLFHERIHGALPVPEEPQSSLCLFDMKPIRIALKRHRQRAAR